MAAGQVQLGHAPKSKRERECRMHAGQRAEGVIFVTWYMLVQCKVARARARGIAVADNRFQIWGGD
jgi:hypothetical protein